MFHFNSGRFTMSTLGPFPVLPARYRTPMKLALTGNIVIRLLRNSFRQITVRLVGLMPYPVGFPKTSGRVRFTSRTSFRTRWNHFWAPSGRKMFTILVDHKYLEDTVSGSFLACWCSLQGELRILPRFCREYLYPSSAAGFRGKSGSQFCRNEYRQCCVRNTWALPALRVPLQLPNCQVFFTFQELSSGPNSESSTLGT